MKKVLAVLLLIALLAPACTAFAATPVYSSTKTFLEVLDKEGISYICKGIDEDCDEYVRIYQLDEDLPYSVEVFFEDDMQHNSIFVWYIITFDEEDLPDVMLACDTLNQTYNYTCFYVDETDNTVTCSMNLIYRDENVDQVFMDALWYLEAIMERAYPVLQPYDK